MSARERRERASNAIIQMCGVVVCSRGLTVGMGDKNKTHAPKRPRFPSSVTIRESSAAMSTCWKRREGVRGDERAMQACGGRS